MSHEPTDTDFMPFLNGKTEDDSSLIVRFFVSPKLMGAKSEAAGRPIYEDREFVEIKIKGQDKQVVVHEVNEHYRNRFPIAYALFQRQKPAPVVGTPIEQLPGIGPSMAHSLKGLNLRTVEDLAAVTDENTIQRIGMGARDMITRAKAWLSQATERESKLAEENERLRKMLAEVQAPVIKKGRKPKQPEAAAAAP